MSKVLQDQENTKKNVNKNLIKRANSTAAIRTSLVIEKEEPTLFSFNNIASPILPLEEHFRNSNFQDKLKIENKSAMFKLKIISSVCCTFMIIEFICGYLAGSLAIMSDATHLLSDLVGFLISLFSLIFAMKPADKTFTFGYHRLEVVGALISVFIIWGLTVWLIQAAIYRIWHPNPIVGGIMVGIAAGSLLFNIIMNRILAYNPVKNSMDEGMGKTKVEKNDENDLQEPLLNEEDENALKHNLQADENPLIQAAYIHILGDMIQSTGVLIAALSIYLLQDNHPGIRILDPICTFCFAIVVLCITIPVSRDCLFVLLESAPRGIDIDSLYQDLNDIEEVTEVHDIHIWNISVGRPSVALHIVSQNPHDTLYKATEVCKQHELYHSIIQVEDPKFKCKHREENDVH